MPYLGDYLGQLMAEIAIARMHADLETVRLAEMTLLTRCCERCPCLAFACRRWISSCPFSSNRSRRLVPAGLREAG